MIFFTPNEQLNVIIERDLSLKNNLLGCCEHGLHQHLSYLLSTRRVSLTVTAFIILLIIFSEILYAGFYIGMCF